mmetsp:Transcript_8434/g.27637  ORF Transcript_8434/g.27637 Transcript_8434/m.27637 type:complete len:105 (+) Transcript_8434:1045-1359(+)
MRWPQHDGSRSPFSRQSDVLQKNVGANDGADDVGSSDGNGDVGRSDGNGDGTAVALFPVALFPCAVTFTPAVAKKKKKKAHARRRRLFVVSKGRQDDMVEGIVS